MWQLIWQEQAVYFWPKWSLLSDAIDNIDYNVLREVNTTHPRWIKSDVQYSGPLREEHVYREKDGIRVQAVDASGAEEHFIDQEYRAEIYEDWESGRAWLCWDLLCYQGLHAST